MTHVPSRGPESGRGKSEAALSPTMKSHLGELALLGEYASWGPQSAGEWRCAEALERRGLLKRNISWGVGRPFTITAKGLEVGRAL